MVDAGPRPSRRRPESPAVWDSGSAFKLPVPVRFLVAPNLKNPPVSSRDLVTLTTRDAITGRRTVTGPSHWHSWRSRETRTSVDSDSDSADRENKRTFIMILTQLGLRLTHSVRLVCRAGGRRRRAADRARTRAAGSRALPGPRTGPSSRPGPIGPGPGRASIGATATARAAGSARRRSRRPTPAAAAGNPSLTGERYLVTQARIPSHRVTSNKSPVRAAAWAPAGRVTRDQSWGQSLSLGRRPAGPAPDAAGSHGPWQSRQAALMVALRVPQAWCRTRRWPSE